MSRMQGVNGDGEEIRNALVVIDSEVRDATDIDCVRADDGMTRQEFADECDINVLMARYEKTGVLNHYNSTPPQYLDLSDMPDLHAAMEVLDAAQAAFMSLPAHVRREFDNDPIKFTEFAADPANVDKMRDWGLAKPLPVDPPPQKVEIVNPNPPPAGSSAA